LAGFCQQLIARDSRRENVTGRWLYSELFDFVAKINTSGELAKGTLITSK
jgi:hypothetical protein